MGIDLRKIDAVLLSHGHYDHGVSLIEVLKRVEKQVLVIAHPKIFNPKFKVKPSLKLKCEKYLTLGLRNILNEDRSSA